MYGTFIYKHKKNFVCISSATDENSRIQILVRILSQWYGSADSDPYQNVWDPQYWNPESKKEVKLARRYGGGMVTRHREIEKRKV